MHSPPVTEALPVLRALGAARVEAPSGGLGVALRYRSDAGRDVVDAELDGSAPRMLRLILSFQREVLLALSRRAHDVCHRSPLTPIRGKFGMP